MRQFISELDTEVTRLILMGVLAFLGGVVRICSNPEHKAAKVVISSLMTAVFAGSLLGALLHDYVADAMYLGAICALGGYSGQLVLVIISKWFEKLLRGRFKP